MLAKDEVMFQANFMPLTLYPQFGKTDVRTIAFTQEGFFVTSDPQELEYLRTDPVAVRSCEEVEMVAQTVQIPTAVKKREVLQPPKEARSENTLATKVVK